MPESQILTILKKLVAIPSVTGEEWRLAEFIVQFLRDQGVQPSCFQNSPHQPNLVVEFPGMSEKVICFNAHMDVLPAGDETNWLHPPFQPHQEGNKLYGRGSVDTKAAVAVYLHLINQIMSKRLVLATGVQFQFVSDEEQGGQNGTQILTKLISERRLNRPSLAIIGERSNLKLRLVDRGMAQFKVTIKGKSTHTAWARAEGVNPIYYAAQAITKLERPLALFSPQIGHPVLSINQISAGGPINQVPESCTFSIDFRTIMEQTLAEVTGYIDSYLREVCSKREELAYEIELLSYTPARATQRGPEVERIINVLSKVLGKAELYLGWAGSTDARFFREMDIPAVVLGPSGANYHGADEYVELDSVYKLARVHTQLLEEKI